MNKYKTRWFMDKKEIPSQNITSYQDKREFVIGDYSRLIKGKLNFFYRQTSSDNNNSSNTYTPTTTFYVFLGSMQGVSYNSLKIIMKDCPSALIQIDKEFLNTAWAKPKYVDAAINDYRALIRIIKIYNACN